tara:strand:+ start:18618 stop:19235 length:618 start_codon:yes stop_codon:yes gene_type:complete
MKLDKVMNKQKKNNLPFKSELIEQSKDLSQKLDTLVKEMQEREYEINFQSRKVFNQLLKFLEKDAPWGHTTATGLIMLYSNLKQQKQKIKSAFQDGWDGIMKIRSANVQIFWTMATKMTGEGFYEAKNFVELMAAVGESLSTAVNKVNNDNAELRETHALINDIESVLSNPERYVDDTVVTGEETFESDSDVLTLANEVDPVVEG